MDFWFFKLDCRDLNSNKLRYLQHWSFEPDIDLEPETQETVGCIKPSLLHQPSHSSNLGRPH